MVALVDHLEYGLKAGSGAISIAIGERPHARSYDARQRAVGSRRRQISFDAPSATWRPWSVDQIDHFTVEYFPGCAVAIMYGSTSRARVASVLYQGFAQGGKKRVRTAAQIEEDAALHGLRVNWGRTTRPFASSSPPSSSLTRQGTGRLVGSCSGSPCRRHGGTDVRNRRRNGCQRSAVASARADAGHARTRRRSRSIRSRPAHGSRHPQGALRRAGRA